MYAKGYIPVYVGIARGFLPPDLQDFASGITLTVRQFPVSDAK